ncbi:MAG: rhodanese-like domain-containing protein [Patescibacteria group bacterium]
MKETKSYETLLLIFMVLAVISGIIFFIFKSWQPKSEKQKITSAPANITINEEKKTNLKTITTSELREKINKKEKIILLDVQKEENFTQKHLPGAINIPASQLDSRKNELPRDKEIIVIGAGEKIDTCQICEKAAESLISFGFSDVRHYKEGIAGWGESGLPLITEITATYKNINSEQLKQKIDDKENILIVDLRDKKEYEQEKIPNAISMPFVGILKRIDELPSDREIIFYDKTSQGSNLIVEELTKKGMINVTNLVGGFLAWKEKGYPAK